MENPATQNERKKSTEKRTRSRSRNRRSRSKSRSRKYTRSRSISPYRGGGRFRGTRNNNNRFNRRSPFRRTFRDRFRRSRSTSRDRRERRRYDSRRSKSATPNAYEQQQQQQQQQHQMHYQSDPFSTFLPTAPQAPQFSGSMAQFNSYDFQANFAPPAPSFSMNPGLLSNIACPAPPGMGDNWIPPPSMQSLAESEEERLRREAAIAEEKKRQREGLKKQRDQCITRSERMKRELKALKQQKSDLLDGLGKRSPSPKTNGFIKENDKLQSQITQKLSETLNVIDMLSGIIGKDSEDEEDKKANKRGRKSESDDSSPERIKNEILKSMDRKRAKENEEKKPPAEKVNYVLFDDELHWCKHCQIFPASAKEYLTHLHSKEHLEKIANRATEAPWRASFQKLNEVPSYPDAPTKRAPIKGLQFFEPSTAWFCKLCEAFMGDSWCVSLHLKSEIHSERYNKLLEREPKFEEKWQEARKKALELTGKAIGTTDNQTAKNIDDKQSSEKKLTDKKAKKKKNKKESKKKRKHGKKRKRGSSSSSSSDSGDDSSSSESETSSKKNDSDPVDSKNSIRVAMRNLLNKAAPAENDERSGKWTMISIDKPSIPPAPTISQNAAKEIKNDEKFIGQWNVVEPVISQEEKRLVESLKGKMKTQQKSEISVAEKSSSIAKKDENNKSRSRSRDRNRADRNYRGKRSRSRLSRSKSRERRRSRSSRSLSRDRRFGGSGGGGRRRYSRSRSRSRSRNRNSRYVRPGVSFPSEPKLPPLKEEKKQPARSYTASTSKKDDSSSMSASALAKRMPFIGKMPVFKKQQVEKKNEDQQEEKKPDEQPTKKAKVDEARPDEKWDELMPDPLQFSQMMQSSAAAQHQQRSRMANEEPVAPPGLDPELDSDSIPKPISDAPVLRQGPLPKDFQATLDLLFDGDKPKPVVIEPTVSEVVIPEPTPIDNSDGPQMIMPEELSQHSILYGSYFQQNSTDAIAPVPPPPPAVAFNNEDSTHDDHHNQKIDEDDDKNDSVEMEDVDEKIKKNQEDMDDLALLGIDVNDVGSGFW